MNPLLSRITIDPGICHGKPCVRGLRYPVETLLELLSSGMTIDEILADYPDLERDDLLAALAYSAELPRLSGKAGWKEAVLRHFAVFMDHGDLEKQLADIRAQGEGE